MQQLFLLNYSFVLNRCISYTSYVCSQLSTSVLYSYTKNTSFGLIDEEKSEVEVFLLGNWLT